jgi:hypothetical protein
MSSNWIIGITVAASLGIFAILYLVSTLERMRTNRSIKIGEWQDRAHRLQQLLASAPNNAVTAAVKTAICTEIRRCLQAILKLDGNNATAKRRYTEIEEILSAIPNEPPATLKLDPIRDANELKTIRRQLTDLFNFVQSAARTGTLEPSVARQEFKTLKHLFTESGATFYLTSAKAEEGKKKTRLALHQYKMAITEYKKANQDKQYDRQIQTIQNAIAHIELHQKSEQAKQPAKAEASSSLASAMDELQSEEDAQWQKKKF